MNIREFFCQCWYWVRLAAQLISNTLAQPTADNHDTAAKDRRRIAREIKKFFDKHYELRYNTLKQAEEFRPRQTTRAANSGDASGLTGGGWQQLTDRELRRIAFEQMAVTGAAWFVDIELYARSTAVADYDPIGDYLQHCPAWDGRNRVDDLARTVPTSCRQWPQWFHRWMLAMVAQWQRRSALYGNALAPLLIGPQGTHKSTFCRRLLPPELRQYYIDDIKLDSAEQVERMLGRMLLVNIDEYNAKTDREQAKIKRVLTERDVQTRRMRSDQYLLLPRMASFIATTNDREPLADPTGSRRYLCCEVTAPIDTDTAIDHAQLYAQLLHELDSGAPYHFSREEEAAIERHNQDYYRQSSAQQLLVAWYEPAARSKENFLRAVDIQQTLRRHLRPADVPTLKALTLALRQAGFAYGSYNNQRGWYGRRREGQKG